MVDESEELKSLVDKDVKNKKISDLSRMLLKEVISKIATDLRAISSAKISYASNGRDSYYIVSDGSPVMLVHLHMDKPIDIVISPVGGIDKKRTVLLEYFGLKKTREKIAVYMALEFKREIKDVRVTLSDAPF